MVSPSKRDRRGQHPRDTDTCKERNRIERLFDKLKRFRRVAIRHDGSAC